MVLTKNIKIKIKPNITTHAVGNGVKLLVLDGAVPLESFTITPL